MVKKSFCFLVLMFLIFSQMAMANDASLSAEGDNVGPFKGTPPITMEKEVVNVKMTHAKSYVDAVFYLRNTENKKITLLVGFPDEPATAKELKSDFPSYQGILKDFRVQVNNQPVSFTSKKQILKKKRFNRSYVLWKVWEMTFAPYERKVVRNSYWVENGRSVLGHVGFSYILRTGATWKGNIGRADIIVTLKGIHPGELKTKANAYLEGRETRFTTSTNFKLQANRLVWTFTNFKPEVNGPGFIQVGLGAELNRLVTKGLFYASQNNYQEALKYYQQFLSALEEGKKVTAYLPEGYFYKDFTKLYLASCRQTKTNPLSYLSSIKPSRPLCYITALIYQLNSSPEQALLSYKKAFARKDAPTYMYDDYGSFLLQINKLDEAKTVFQQETKEYPGYWKAFVNLGRAYSRLGLTKEAIANYDKGLKRLDETYKDDVKRDVREREEARQYYIELANLYTKSGKPAMAKKAVLRSLEFKKPLKK